jgi:Pyridoxamine 5'-phosphate oxidase
VTASLPEAVQAVFDRFITTEYTTIDAAGKPITWPVTPYYRPGDPCIDITTGLGYPKKANDARKNPKVALLFSDPTGCGFDDPPAVLVQGTAEVDDRDLEANRIRYEKEATEKLPGAREMMPPNFMKRMLSWYLTRIYVHVRPERVYVWERGDLNVEPQLFDSHMEEVRSGHDEEPETQQAPPEGGALAWDERLDELGKLHKTAVVSFVAPDGFPFALRVPVRVDQQSGLVWLEADPVGVPLAPGLACLTAHDHDERFTYQRNFQLRGDLVNEQNGWAIRPHKLVGGFELPPGSALARAKLNLGKARRFRRIAKSELDKIESGSR